MEKIRIDDERTALLRKEKEDLLEVKRKLRMEADNQSNKLKEELKKMKNSNEKKSTVLHKTPEKVIKPNITSIKSSILCSSLSKTYSPNSTTSKSSMTESPEKETIDPEKLDEQPMFVMGPYGVKRKVLPELEPEEIEKKLSDLKKK